MSNAGISRAKTTVEHTFVSSRARTFQPQANRPMLCTTDDLHRCLYKRDDVIFVSKEDFRTSLRHKEEVHSYWCKGCRQERTEQCQLHGSHQTFKLTKTVNNNNNINNSAVGLPNAVESFPNEVGLCISGIPGVGYGVCAKQTIPLGTWIGPYEGELVRPEEVLSGTDTSYMWEIFHEGQLLYYIDGRDENKSSWMRYIRCARHRGEQNMFAFQYCGHIYYRAFQDIPATTELLVWYDDKYPQYMGIPLEICETSPRKPLDQRQHSEMVVVVPHETSNPGSSYSHQPSSRPLVDNLQPSSGSRSTKARPLPPSRDVHDRSHNPLRAMRNLTQNVYQGSETFRATLPTAGHKRERHASRVNDGAPLKFNAPEADNSPSFSEDVRFTRENQAVSFGQRSGITRNSQTNGHHDATSSKELYAMNTMVPLTTVEERQPKSGDEEANSSDGSDTSFFNCGQCGRSFAQRSVLQIHVCPNRPHKPYHCGHCNQSFDNPNQLRTHAVIHVGEKPFKCGYCDRSFAGATTLHNHVRTHTGEKPFTCERCGKNFTQASQLHKHEGLPGDCVPYEGLPE